MQDETKEQSQSAGSKKPFIAPEVLDWGSLESMTLERVRRGADFPTGPAAGNDS